jgi:hypothetical protein
MTRLHNKEKGKTNDRWFLREVIEHRAEVKGMLLSGVMVKLICQLHWIKAYSAGKMLFLDVSMKVFLEENSI